MKALDFARRYSVALIVAGVAVGLWYYALRSLEPNPFAMLLAGVAVAAIYGGLGPGILATVACSVAAFFLYTKHGAPLDIFAVLALAVTWLTSPVRPAQQELKRQIVYTRAISDHIAEGILVFSAHGRVTFANSAMQQIIGWSSAELRRKELFHPTQGSAYREDSPIPANAILPALHGQSVAIDRLVLKSKDGRSVTVTCRASPIFHRGDQIGTVIECSVAAQSEEQVVEARAQQDHYRRLVDGAPDGVILTDLYGFMLLVNVSAATMHGYSDPGEMIGVKIEEVFDESSRALGAQARMSVFQQGLPQIHEYLSRRRDGIRFPTEVQTAAVRDAAGTIVAVASYVRDITAQKKEEEQRQAERQRLALQYSATQMLLEASALDQVLWKWLQTVCTAARWEVGIFWRIDESLNALQCVEIWNPSWLSINGFADMTRQLHLAPGSDLPGRVWLSGESKWVGDVVREPGFSRSAIASKEGIESAFSFPVSSSSAIYGVCELFCRTARPLDPDLADALSQLGFQLGTFIERTRSVGRVEEVIPDGRNK